MSNTKVEPIKGVSVLPTLSKDAPDLPSSDKSDGLTSSEAKTRAKAVVDGVKYVLHHHNCPKTVVRSFCSQLLPYLSAADEKAFLARAKYVTTLYMAKYLKGDLPKKPDQEDFLPVGHWKRWLKSRMVLNPQNTHLWYSFLQCKRAADPLSESMILSTYEKHREAMGKKDPIDRETLRAVMDQLEPLLHQIRGELVNEYGDPYRHEGDYVGSTSACYEYSRSKGGAIQYLFYRFKSWLLTKKKVSTCESEMRELQRMEFYPKCSINGEVRTNYTHEFHWYPIMDIYWHEFVSTYALPESLIGDEQSYPCIIQAVVEPLKIRVISKGPALPYYISKHLQKTLHGVMRRYPCFRLIGRPLVQDDLTELPKFGYHGGEGEKMWMSVDYSAATDCLSASLSREILGFLIEPFPEDLRRIFIKVLAPHRCEYPKVDGVQLPEIQQQNGQLMGSILSFPILCLANLGLYLQLTRRDPRSIESRMRGVLVNGDDMLYYGRESLWQEHIDLGRKIGLEMSVGKAYKHKIFANANSMCFHYDVDKGTPRYIPFLNVGLIRGQGKVLASDEEITRSKISVIPEILRGSRESRKCEVLKQYISRHRGDIQRESTFTYRGGQITRNLFVSERLGGFGIEAPKGWKFSVTDEQRRLAQRFLELNPFYRVKVTGEEIDQDLVKLDNSVHKPWEVEKRVSRFKFPGLSDKPLDEDSCIKGVYVSVEREIRVERHTRVEKYRKIQMDYDRLQAEFDAFAISRVLQPFRDNSGDRVDREVTLENLSASVAWKEHCRNSVLWWNSGDRFIDCCNDVANSFDRKCGIEKFKTNQSLDLVANASLISARVSHTPGLKLKIQGLFGGFYSHSLEKEIEDRLESVFTQATKASVKGFAPWYDPNLPGGTGQFKLYN